MFRDKEKAMINPMRSALLSMSRMLPLMFLSATGVDCAPLCQITPTQIGVVRLGADRAEVIKALEGQYSVTVDERPGAAATLSARPKNKKESQPVVIANLTSNRVFLVDSYEDCPTAEGIGPGVTLARARETYGQGHVEPSDLGYFVWFVKKEGVLFLLDNNDIPVRLKGIADDALSSESEREIFQLENVRISAVRISE
jgi:hypothetical protein